MPTDDILVSETDDSEPQGTDSTASEPDKDDDVSEFELNDDEDDGELLHFSVDAPEPIRRIVLHLCKNYETAFPKVQGRRHLHAFNFDMLLDQLRAMFLHY